jgi:hypothetical protein
MRFATRSRSAVGIVAIFAHPLGLASAEALESPGSDGRQVVEVVKRLFRDAGATPGAIDGMGAHNLRRGFVTAADIAGATTAALHPARAARRSVLRKLFG